MHAERFVSFFEVSLVDTSLLVRLGSGLDADVMRLSPAVPSIRVCVPEIPGVGHDVRVRYGRAELTDEGPSPIRGDVFEMRGARGRTLGLGSGTIRALASHWQAGGPEHSLLASIGPGWLRFGAGGLKAAGAADAQAAFAADVAPEDSHEAWVYVDMGPTQLDTFAALIATSEEDTVSRLVPGSP